MPGNISLRPAKLNEAKLISNLINDYAVKNIMLPRDAESIIERIQSFQVALIDNELAGCCSVAFFTEDLAEIRSLVVKEKYQGTGIGRALVERAELVLREEGIKKAFALTLTPEFFQQLCYQRVDKSNFPQKIWRDCLNCSKIMMCDEIALEKDLN